MIQREVVMKRIGFFLFMLTVTLSVGLASGASEQQNQQQTLTVSYYDWQLTETPTGDIIRRQLAKYEKTHPGVKIELQAVPTAQRGDKLMAMVLGGMAPDIVHINEADIARFVPMGSLEVLDGYLEKTPDLKGELVPAMNAMSTFDGKLYGIPRFASINTLIYNADHFRQAGLDPDRPPKSWDEFVEYGRKLTRDTNDDSQIDRWGAGILGAKTGSVGFRYWWALWSAGGQILSPDNSKSMLGTQASIDALQFYTDLALKYEIVPPGVAEVDYTALVNDFIAEKTSMICDGPWQIARIREENPNIELRAAAMPAKDGFTSATTGGGGFLGISATSKHKEAAWDVIQFLSNAESHWQYVSEGSFLPTRKDTSAKLRTDGDALLGEFGETLQYSKLTPAIPEMTQINLLLAEEIQFILIGQKNAAQAARSLDERVNALLNQ